MDPRLGLLLELQEVYSEQKLIEDDYDVIPKRRNEIESMLTRIKEEGEAAAETCRELEIEQKTRELELQTNQESRVRKEAQLLTIKNEKEYEATMAEIESLDRKNSRHESRLLEIMEGIETQTKTKEEKEQEFTQKTDQFKDELEKLAEREKGLSERLEAAKKITHSVADKMSPDLLQRFLRIFKSKQGMAVVPANNGHCGGCNIVLTPRLMQLVRRGQDLVQCESCQRFLYWEQEEEIHDLSAL